MNVIQKSEAIKNGLRKGFQDGSSKSLFKNFSLAPPLVTFSSFPCHAKTPPFLQPGGVFGKVDSPFCCCLYCFPLSSVATAMAWGNPIVSTIT